MASKENWSELSNGDTHFLSIAIATAKTSGCRQKHGAVVVLNGNIVAQATNVNKNNPRNVARNFSVHAEVAALRRLGLPSDLRPPKYVLYVARVNAHDEPVLSRPCNNCWGVMAIYNVKEVVYTT